MYCGKCGAQLPDNAVFCSVCGENVAGAPVNAAAGMQNNATGYTDQPQQPDYQQPTYQQPDYQNTAYQQNYAQPGAGYTDPYQQQPNGAAFNAGWQNAYPMKWYKFLIYFSLFAGAVLNFISGVMCLNGSQYEGGGASAELVWAFYDGLKTADTIFGIACIVSAVLLIYTRFQLAGFKRNGPNMLTITYVYTCVISLIYIIAVSSIVSGYGVDATDIASSAISSLIGSVVMIVINFVYFNKRKSLFVN